MPTQSRRRSRSSLGRGFHCLCLPNAPAAAAPPAPPSLTAEEALRQAEAEGLTLQRSELSSTGFKGVSFVSGSKSKPYNAKVKRGGKAVHLGDFATADASKPVARPELPPLTAAPRVKKVVHVK